MRVLVLTRDAFDRAMGVIKKNTAMEAKRAGAICKNTNARGGPDCPDLGVDWRFKVAPNKLENAFTTAVQQMDAMRKTAKNLANHLKATSKRNYRPETDESEACGITYMEIDYSELAGASAQLGPGSLPERAARYAGLGRSHPVCRNLSFSDHGKKAAPLLTCTGNGSSTRSTTVATTNSSHPKRATDAILNLEEVCDWALKHNSTWRGRVCEKGRLKR